MTQLTFSPVTFLLIVPRLHQKNASALFYEKYNEDFTHDHKLQEFLHHRDRISMTVTPAEGDENHTNFNSICSLACS